MLGDYLRSKKKGIFITGLLCLVFFVAFQLANNLYIHSPESEIYNAEAILKNKTAYVGDNSKVVNLINTLPYANSHKEVSLKTEALPYGITVNYDLDYETNLTEGELRNNAIILFALIGNVDVINFNLNIKTSIKEINCQYSRAQLQQSYAKDLREYARDPNSLELLINSFGLRISAYPEMCQQKAY